MTREVPGPGLAEAIARAFEGAVADIQSGWVELSPDRLLPVMRWLHDAPEHDFRQLLSLSAVDRLRRFEVVYHLVSHRRNHMACVKVGVTDREAPEVDSVTPIWAGANLQEREAYDLMGIRFRGHPDLRRLFLWEGFAGWPLRKDFLQIPGKHPGLARFPHEVPGQELDLTPRGTI
ncbi:MAG TPA: NADH-quinone oxidoreductase subunit C [Dehalococcoidia bacterium]|nr:NADH-quinone oxidoreductase subunit C [Dehalococcoidia bacterium]